MRIILAIICFFLLINSVKSERLLTFIRKDNYFNKYLNNRSDENNYFKEDTIIKRPHTLSLGLLGSPESFFAIDYEYSYEIFKSIYIIPQAGIGLFPGLYPTILTSSHAYINGGFKLFKPVKVYLGIGMYYNPKFSRSYSFISQVGLNLASRNGFYLKLFYYQYRDYRFFEALTIGINFGYSFGKKRYSNR